MAGPGLVLHLQRIVARGQSVTGEDDIVLEVWVDGVDEYRSPLQQPSSVRTHIREREGLHFAQALPNCNIPLKRIGQLEVLRKCVSSRKRGDRWIHDGGGDQWQRRGERSGDSAK